MVTLGNTVLRWSGSTFAAFNDDTGANAGTADIFAVLGSVASNNSSTWGQRYIWIEGNYNGMAETGYTQHANRVIYLNGVSLSRFRNLNITGSSDKGLFLTTKATCTSIQCYMWNNFFENLSIANNSGVGMQIGVSTANSPNFRANRMYNLKISNNGQYGLNMYGFPTNGNSLDNSLIKALVANNDYTGLRFEGFVNKFTMANINSFHNGITAGTNDGLLLTGAALTIGSFAISHTLLLNNQSYGLEINNVLPTKFAHLAIAHNGNIGISLNGGATAAYDHTYTGLLYMGNNNNLTTTAGNSNASAGGNNGLKTTAANNNSPSSFTRWDATDFAPTFLGFVTSTDSSNQTNSNGQYTFNNLNKQSNFGDWFNVANVFRIWAYDGAADFPDYGNRARCNSGYCRLFDVRIKSTDTVLLGRSGNGTLGTATTNYTITAGTNTCPRGLGATTGNSPAAGSAEDGTGNTVETTLTDYQTSANTYLINAVEIIGDGIGDDDGLCENNEDCIYSPNIGYYQGSGPISTGYCTGVTANGDLGGSGFSGTRIYGYKNNGE